MVPLAQNSSPRLVQTDSRPGSSGKSIMVKTNNNLEFTL